MATQAQMCELYQTSKSNVSEHIEHIFEEGELDEESVVRKFRTTASDGKSYNTTFYNLDMIIALGYRIKSVIATRFRQWATQRLKEYMIKGFTLTKSPNIRITTKREYLRRFTPQEGASRLFLDRQEDELEQAVLSLF